MFRPRRRDDEDRADQALVRAGALGALVGLVPYLGALWDWGLHPLRRMSVNGTNANFYDLQARALFHGHLDVPPGSLGIEAFVVDSRHYMYFGPFPALLRMPLLAVTDRFDGRLTAPSMLVGWCVLAVGLIALMRIVRRVVAPDLAIGRGIQVGVATLMATVLGGSSLVFLASQPWVYHEVYVWSAAGNVVTLAALIHLGVAPTRRALLVVVGAGLATMLTRAPAGWALAAATIATGAWLVVRASRSGVAGRRTGVAVTVGGVATIVAGAGVNWAKFHHPYLFPIQDQVWSQLSAHRQVVLALNHGRLDGPRFVWSTLTAYFRPDGVRFTTVFPFVWTPAHPPGAVGGVRLDESFRTGSVPALMPLLFVPMLWAAVVAFGRRRPGGPTAAAAALRLPLLGAALATGGVMAFGYIAPRYLADFIPVLALGSFVGWADIARRVNRSSGTQARVVGGLVVGLAVYGVVANSALALANARQNWRGDRLESLVSAQDRISAVTGHPLDGHVHEVDELPPSGLADDYYIVGDCHAVYLATGERAGAWVPVQTRPVEFRIVIGAAGVLPGSAPLMWFPGFTLRRLNLQADLDGRVRLTLVGAAPDSAGRWLDAAPGDVIAVSVTSDTARNRYVARAVGEEERSLTSVPMSEWDRRFDIVQIGAVITLASDDELAAVGVTATATWGPVPDLCSRLRS